MSFHDDRARRLQAMRRHPGFASKAEAYQLAIGGRMDYAFDWLGVPIIQLPEDVLALQECVVRGRADVVVETGVARGGSIVFYASLLAATHARGDFKVIGIDIDIRPHTRSAIEASPFAEKIELLQSSSTAPGIRERIAATISPGQRVMVVLDSDHEADHVWREIEAYKELVADESFLVVMDTGIEYRDPGYYADRNWGPGNSPMTAVDRLLKSDPRFVVDEAIDSKIAVTASPRGYLRKRKG